MSIADSDKRRLRGQERRLELLNNLEAIFLREGYRGILMDDLARRLRCSKRSLYEIGRNREELALAVLARWSKRIDESAWAATALKEDPAERIAAYLRPGVDESRAISRVLLRDIAVDKNVLAFVRQHQANRVAGLRDLIREGVRKRRFRAVNSEFIAAISMAAIERIDDPDLLASANLEFADAFDEFYTVLVAGLKA